MKWTTTTVASNVSLNGGAVTTTFGTPVPGLTDDDRTAFFTVTSTVEVTQIRFTGPAIEVPANFTGDIVVEVRVIGETAAGDFVWDQTSSVRIATIVAPSTTSTAVSRLPVVRGLGAQAAGNIRIVENIAGSLADGSPAPVAPVTNVIRLAAPAGVTFAAVPNVSAGGTPVLADSNRAVDITLATSTAAATIEVSNIRLNILETVADGDINIAISGANVTPASVAVAAIGVVGFVEPSRVGATVTRNAGRLGEGIPNIRLTERTGNAFLVNRMLTLSLPTGFTWNTAPTTTWAAGPVVSEAGRVITYWITSEPVAGDYAGSVELTGLTINTHINPPTTDIVVTVGGNAGASGTVTVGTLRRPVTVNAVTTPNVRADSLEQALGNIVITEAAAGALIAGGDIVITLPVGTILVGTPTVTRTAGTGATLPTIGTVTGNNTNVITIPVDAASAGLPATVTVSGIRVNLDRLPAGTPVSARISGDALLEGWVLTTNTAGLAGTTEANADTARGTVVAEGVVLANVVSRTARTTVFTIDSTAFTVDGVAQPALEVAPFVDPASNRTLVPLRAVANAAGVLDRNIAFVEDKIAQTQKVILVRDGRVVQFTIGETSMVVNGVVLPIDQAPMIINGRTVLPVRALEMALGVALEWDGTARTVTVKLD
jgi:hypothetical protein